MTIEQGSLKDLKQWLDLNKITEVECIFPDMAGSTKGKILPVNRFVKSVEALYSYGTDISAPR